MGGNKKKQPSHKKGSSKNTPNSIWDLLPFEITSYIFSFVDYNGNDWMNIMCTCKRFLLAGRRTFHPLMISLRNQLLLWRGSTYGRARMVRVLLENGKRDLLVELIQHSRKPVTA